VNVSFVSGRRKKILVVTVGTSIDLALLVPDTPILSPLLNVNRTTHFENDYKALFISAIEACSSSITQ
jgi:hypothetical protein